MNKKITSLILALAMILCSVSSFAKDDEEKPQVKVAEAAYGTPVIDGEQDSVWNSTNYNVFDNVVGTDSTFYKGWFKVLWDDENMYMLAKVYSEQFSNMDDSPWENDSIEYFIDEDCKRTTTYYDDDYQLRIGFDSALSANNYDVNKMTGKAVKGDNYYIAELSFPYKTVTPYDGMEIGFDVQANASKMIGFARTLYAWNVKSGAPQANTSTHGSLILRKSVAVKQFEEPVYEPRKIEVDFNGISQEETVKYLDNVTTTFDGKEYNYPIVLVNEHPSMEIGNLADVIGGKTSGNTLTVGDVKLTYTEDSRLAQYGDGHLMLDRCPKRVNGKLYVPLNSLLPTTGWTVDYRRFNNAITIETGTNYPEPEVTVNVKDYGAVGDGKAYDRDAVIAAFKAAAALAEAGTPSKLEFEAGKTYRINEKQDAFALFDLDNISNFIIDGNGSTILFERPTNSLINIEGCTNIKVKNIDVKYDERVIIWGYVKSVNEDGQSINIEIPEDSPLPADDAWAQYYCSNTSDGPWIFGNLMDSTDAVPRFLPFDALMIKSVEKVQGREYKVTFKSSIAMYSSHIQEGDRFPFKSRWNSYDFGEYNKYGRPDFISVSYSKDVTFEGVKTTNSLLMLAPMSYNQGRITLKDCEMSLAPGAIITSSADGVHTSSNRFGVIIDNCTFENSFDDLINTEAYCGAVTKTVDSYIYETSRDMQCVVGDEIAFFNTSNHEIVGTAFLKEIEKTEDGKYRLTVDRKIDKVVSQENSTVPTSMYNLDSANKGNIIRNSTFRNSRRHAYIIRSACSIIENNRMENNAGAATEAANEIHGTSNEGLVPSALTFRNNVVKSDGIGSQYVPLKVYSWNAQLGEQACIDGVLIENNTIDVPSLHGSISINSVTGLYMLNNTIKADKMLNESTQPVVISNSSIKMIDGLNFDYKQNVNAVITIAACEVDESNIKNINIIGSNTAVPYSIK
ncbi:MAG: sugar-binding protein [Clostridia bacterium]|nr:sugar-binding protein [Clostridia bacterium]